MSGGGERKIAMIVALDAVGYSHQSEVDEQVAIDAVTGLRARVTDGAAAHGGHVFNSAGDGFMLEFASASGALAFAEEILTGSRVPVRAGAHLGEVALLPNGDLLGHGVNVAARLLALATPGELLASADVKRALPPAKGARFEPRGEVQLDKMQARIEVMRFAPAWRPPSGPRNWLRGVRAFVSRRRRATFAIGAAGLGAVALALYLAMQSPTVPANVLAVLPFDALYADPDAQFYADGIAAALANAASEAGVPVVSTTLSFRYRGANKANAARQLGALYVIDGNVRREAGRLRISLHLDDARTGATALTRAYDAPQTEAGALSERVAADVAVLIGGFDLDQSSVWGFLPRLAHIAQQDGGGDALGAYESARALAADSPNSAIVQTMVAFLAQNSIEQTPSEQRAQLVASGRAAARRALAINPRFADAYAALANLTPKVNWAEREALLRRGLVIDPAASNIPNFLGELFWEAGKWREAAPLFEASLSRDPISPEKTQSRLNVLIGQQHWAQARPLMARATRLWPAERWVAYAQFNLALYGSDPNQALALIRSGDVAALDAGDGLHAFGRLAEAMIGRRPGDIDTAARDCTGPDRQSSSRACFLVLSALGRLNEAFALADERYPDLRGPTPEARERRWLTVMSQFHDPSALFDPHARALRADPRFAALVERLGLVDYWRANGPPDFCAVESAPVCVGLRR